MGTTTFVRLDKVNKPVKLSFLVCEDDGDEALLSLDALVDLSIVPPDFPCPMDPSIRDHKIRKLQRIENLRTQLSFPQETREEDKEEEKCEELRQAWLEDYQEVFKEDLTIDDRIEMEPVRVGLVENHEDIPIPHPKAANDIPAYLCEAADRELARMLAGGLLEKVEEYTETVSRGFFVEKKTLPGEEPKVRLVADFRSVNIKLQRPEYPLDNSSAILKRLNPKHRFFGSIDMSSGYSQIPLAEEDRHWFTILLPQGKFRFCVLPQGLSISPELFDIHTAPSIRNTDNCYKNADDILAGGTTLEQLDDTMRRVLSVCRDRGIKLAPSKLQCGRKLKWGGVIVESVGHREGRSDVLITPEEEKLREFLDLERPNTKKDVQMICGLAAQMKKFAPGMQVQYPGMQKLCAANISFTWTTDLDKELTDLKTCLMNHVKLSPVDTSKGLILVIDSAATVGTSCT